jgi:hypothetical protein
MRLKRRTIKINPKEHRRYGKAWVLTFKDLIKTYVWFLINISIIKLHREIIAHKFKFSFNKYDKIQRIIFVYPFNSFFFHLKNPAMIDSTSKRSINVPNSNIAP